MKNRIVVLIVLALLALRAEAQKPAPAPKQPARALTLTEITVNRMSGKVVASAGIPTTVPTPIFTPTRPVGFVNLPAPVVEKFDPGVVSSPVLLERSGKK